MARARGLAFCILPAMDFREQLPPNKPNFKLILALFAVGIVVILVLAIFFLRHNATHLEPSGKPSPTSGYLQPLTPAPHLAKAV